MAKRRRGSGMTWHGQQASLQNHRKFLESVAGGSPYLRALMLRDPRFLADILSHSPEDLLASLCAGIHAAQTLSSQAEIMVALRHAKAKASLLIALADLGEVWSVDEVTAALTRFADAMLGATVNWLLLDGHARRKISLYRSRKIHRATAAMWCSPWASMVLAN